MRDELSRSLARRAGDRTRRTASPPTNAEPDQQRAATSTKPFRQTQPAGTGTRCAMYRVERSHSGRAWRPFIKRAQLSLPCPWPAVFLSFPPSVLLRCELPCLGRTSRGLALVTRSPASPRLSGARVVHHVVGRVRHLPQTSPRPDHASTVFLNLPDAKRVSSVITLFGCLVGTEPFLSVGGRSVAVVGVLREKT